MTEFDAQPAHANSDGIQLFPLDGKNFPTVELGWCALDDRGLIEVSGSDAESFLQGQLTQDMARVRAGQVLLAAHCNPKGRITALFRAWPSADGFLLDLPATLAAAAQRRLGLYVLRSRVTLVPAVGRWARTALFGAQAQATLERLGIAAPGTDIAASQPAEHRCAALGGSRFLVLSTPAAGASLRAALAALCPPDDAGYELCCVRAGEPEVYPETVDAFIPQMLNLDLNDGVSFRKGCYTGQEIVARAHYLGRVKRRLQHFAFEAAPGLIPGQSLAEGVQLVRWQPTGPNGGELLAVAAIPGEAATGDHATAAASNAGPPGTD